MEVYMIPGIRDSIVIYPVKHLSAYAEVPCSRLFKDCVQLLYSINGSNYLTLKVLSASMSSVTLEFASGRQFTVHQHPSLYNALVEHGYPADLTCSPFITYEGQCV